MVCVYGEYPPSASSCGRLRRMSSSSSCSSNFRLGCWRTALAAKSQPLTLSTRIVHVPEPCTDPPHTREGRRDRGVDYLRQDVLASWAWCRAPLENSARTPRIRLKPARQTHRRPPTRGSGFEPLGFGLWGRDCAGRYQQEASGAHPRRRVGIPRAGCQPPWRSYCACPSNSAPPCAHWYTRGCTSPPRTRDTDSVLPPRRSGRTFPCAPLQVSRASE